MPALPSGYSTILMTFAVLLSTHNWQHMQTQISLYRCPCNLEITNYPEIAYIFTIKIGYTFFLKLRYHIGKGTFPDDFTSEI